MCLAEVFKNSNYDCLLTKKRLQNKSNKTFAAIGNYPYFQDLNVSKSKYFDLSD